MDTTLTNDVQLDEPALPSEAVFKTVKDRARSARQRNDRARTIYRGSRGAARWVGFLEMMLSAVEETVWELRETYQEIVDEIAGTWGGAKEELTGLQERRRSLEAELCRLVRISKTVATVVVSYRTLSIFGAFMSRKGYEARLARLHRKNAARLIDMAEKLQGGMIKVGQMLAARPDLLPGELTEALSVLQDRVTPMPIEIIRRTLVNAWGEERLNKVWIEPAPIGAASIAQVHRATLPDGRKVAVKVRRPGIEQILRHDMANLRRVLNALTAYLPDFELDPVIDEIETQVLNEVDFADEGRAMIRAAELTRGLKGVAVPEVVPEWSAEEVLVTEFHEGLRLDEALKRRAENGGAAKVKTILARMVDLYARQILVWGFFQPDTHPANFLVREDDTLVLLDYGCSREIESDFRLKLVKLVQEFAAGKDAAVADILKDIGFATRSGDLKPVVNSARLMLSDLVGGGEGAWDADKLKAEILDAADRMLEDPVTRVPAEIVMVGRALGTLGGMFFVHRPNLDPVLVLFPVLAEALRETPPN